MGRSEFCYNKEIGYLYIPDIFALYPIGNTNQRYAHKSNKQGFRSDYDFTLEKNKSKRFIFLGDSHCAGTGVSNSSRFTDIIERNLEDTECYNFGLSGSGHSEQLLIYENIASLYEHDVVFFSPFVSDISRHSESKWVVDNFSSKIYKQYKPLFVLRDNQLELVNYPPPYPSFDTLRKIEDEKPQFNPSSNFFKFLFQKLPHDSRLPLSLREYLLKIKYSRSWKYSKGTYNWNLTLKIIERLIKNSGTKQIMLCPIPYPNTLNFPNYRELFSLIAQQYENVFFIDLMNNLSKMSILERWNLTYGVDKHHNELGHQFIAKSIIDWFTSEIGL